MRGQLPWLRLQLLSVFTLDGKATEATCSSRVKLSTPAFNTYSCAQLNSATALCNIEGCGAFWHLLAGVAQYLQSLQYQVWDDFNIFGASILQWCHV